VVDFINETQRKKLIWSPTMSLMKSSHSLRIVCALLCCCIFFATTRLQADDVATAPKNSAIIPVFHAGTTAKHEKINERAKQGDVDLIFIGDSITDMWATRGKQVWDKFYGNRKAMNAGIGGDTTQNVLWRLDNGNIDGIHPKLAVIMIGTNNSNGNSNTAEEIADGIKAIVKEVHEKLPETKILLLGIFPRRSPAEEHLEKVMSRDEQSETDKSELASKMAAAKETTRKQVQKNAEASRLASQIADNNMIFYMDIGDKLLDANKELSRDIMPDYLHPNAKGYEIWAEAIEPKVAELMGEKK
jgi:lysophospholipase L1-like esterase